MARAEVMTQKKRQVVIQKNKICNYGKARYLYENGVARERGFVLSRSFNNSVKYELPKVYNKKVYMQFIEKWGTVRMYGAYNNYYIICFCAWRLHYTLVT